MGPLLVGTAVMSEELDEMSMEVITVSMVKGGEEIGSGVPLDPRLKVC
jgi:hypothetical protein